MSTQDEATVANKAVCELLGLKAGAPAEDVTAKIMELKGGTIDGVNVLEELKALKQQNAQRDADEAVTLALKAGKITPAQKDWARSYWRPGQGPMPPPASAYPCSRVLLQNYLN